MHHCWLFCCRFFCCVVLPAALSVLPPLHELRAVNMGLVQRVFGCYSYGGCDVCAGATARGVENLPCCGLPPSVPPLASFLTSGVGKVIDRFGRAP